MLPKNARLTASEDFARATKSGIRVTVENFVGYLYISPATNEQENISAKCGLIINKTVGGSVVRHALARKVRHALASQVEKLPKGSLLVVRALSQKKTGPFTLTTNLKKDVCTEIETLVNKLLERQSKAAAR